MTSQQEEAVEATRAAAQALIEGVGDLFRVQLSIAGADVAKAVAVMEVVTRDFEHFRGDLGVVTHSSAGPALITVSFLCSCTHHRWDR
ncbi:unnamed protein product [Discosporangium mesarthrocarpum]